MPRNIPINIKCCLYLCNKITACNCVNSNPTASQQDTKKRLVFKILLIYRCDFQPMRVPEEPVGNGLFWQNPVLTSLQLEISRSCRTASEQRRTLNFSPYIFLFLLGKSTVYCMYSYIRYLTRGLVKMCSYNTLPAFQVFFPEKHLK